MDKRGRPIVVALLASPLWVMLASADAPVDIEVVAGSTWSELSVVNRGAEQRLSAEIALEYWLRGEWIRAPIINFHLREACESKPSADCISIAPASTLRVMPWTGETCAAQRCPVSCRLNAPAHAGIYRFVVRSCDGAREYRSAPFEKPPTDVDPRVPDPPPAVAAIQGYAFDSDTRVLSKVDVFSATKSLAAPTVATDSLLVVVQLQGAPYASFQPPLGVRIRATSLATSRRVFDQVQPLRSLDSNGTRGVSFLARDHSCTPLRISAWLDGRDRKPQLNTTVSVGCKPPGALSERPGP